MRLVSALCAFLVAGTSNSVAIPRYSDFGMVSVGGYNEYDSKSYKRRRNQSFAKSRLGDAKVLRTVSLMLGVPLGLAIFCIAGKLGEVGVKKYVMPAVDNFLYNQYKVLVEKFNLAGILGYVKKTANSVDSIGRGLASLIEYLNSNKSKNSENVNLDKFEYSYENVVAICFMLSLAYKPGKLASSLNELGKLWQSVKKDWIPGFYRRPDFKVGNKKQYEEAAKAEYDISYQTLRRLTKSSGIWDKESISIPFNIEALKKWLTGAFTSEKDEAFTFRGKFSVLKKGGVVGRFDDLSWKTVTRTGDKLTLVSNNTKLTFVVGEQGEQGEQRNQKLMLSFNIPVKEDTKGDGGDLIHVNLV